MFNTCLDEKLRCETKLQVFPSQNHVFFFRAFPNAGDVGLIFKTYFFFVKFMIRSCAYVLHFHPLVGFLKCLFEVEKHDRGNIAAGKYEKLVQTVFNY